MIAVSRAPISKLQAYKRRMGWTFPGASSLDSDFNFDFNTSFTEEQQRSGSVDDKYRATDTTWLRQPGKRPGRTVGHVPVVDRAPKGRNDTGAWFRPRDQYE